jgi:hypothetical protein
MFFETVFGGMESAIRPLVFRTRLGSYESVGTARSPKFDITLTVQQGAAYTGTEGNIAAIEFMTSFRAISLAKNRLPLTRAVP